MKVKECVEFRRLPVNERNFQRQLEKARYEYGENIAFACKSQVLHEISKKGKCLNTRRGFTAIDDGICMRTTYGTMGFNTLDYNVYPFDIFPGVEALKGVETEITAVYYSGTVRYKLPWKEETIEKVFILEYE